MEKINILLTAAGGDIASSAYKILCEQDFIKNIFFCDVSTENAVANLHKENFDVILAGSSPEYLTVLESIVKKRNIDIIIPLSEPEIRALQGKDKILNAKLILPSTLALQIGLDKLKTAQFLKENNLAFINTYKACELKEPKSYPCIIKDPLGCGSKNMYIIENSSDYAYYSSKFSSHIVQDYIYGDEYTCGLYRHADDIRTIVFLRKLKGGLSISGQLIKNNAIDDFLINLAQLLNLDGSINVQLKLEQSSKKPIVFEINPRFSSTVLFRHLFGFKDLLWCVQDAIGIQKSKYNPKPIGTKFFKVYQEVII